MHYWASSFLVLLLGHLAAPASANDNQSKLYDLAFNPERQFTGETQFGPLMSAIYRGDDRKVPVFSLAVGEVCKNQAASCDFKSNELVARIVRSPVSSDSERPRSAGYALLARLNKAGVKSEKALKDALDKGAVEWLETPIASCKSAATALDAVREAQWIVKSDTMLDTLIGVENDLPILLHFDTMLIKFQHSYSQKIQYDGFIEDYSKIDDKSENNIHVTAATLRFMKVIEPCLKKSTSTPPWLRRKPIAVSD